MVDYTVRKTNGDILLTIPEGSVNAQTLLTLPGRLVANYGEIIGEDFIRLLENFASPTPPTTQHPDKIFLNGQLWYDTDKNVLKVYNKESTLNAPAEWLPVNKILVSSSIDITGDYEGQLLWHTTTRFLYAWNASASSWKLIGPVNLSELEEQLNEIRERLEELETDTGGWQTDISGLLSRMSAAEGNISSLNNRVGALEVTVTTIEGDISSLQNRATTTEGNVTNLTTRTTTLEGKMDSAEDQLEDHEVRIDALEEWRATIVDPALEDIEDGILGAVRRWYQDPDWLVHWVTPTFVDVDSFRINGGDYRDYFEVGKTVRAHLGGGTYRYGSITAVSFSGGNTTVDASWDGALTSGINEVALALVESAEVQAAEIPTGSRMIFYQASAPTGWTQVTDVHDAALRVVGATGGGTGGTLDFSSVFAERSVPATGDTEDATVTVDAHAGDSGSTPTTMPEHTHGGVITDTASTTDGVVGALISMAGTFTEYPDPESGPTTYTVSVYIPGDSDAAGTSAGEHVHTIDHTHTTQVHSHGIDIDLNIDFGVKYADVIICQKT